MESRSQVRKLRTVYLIIVKLNTPDIHQVILRMEFKLVLQFWLLQLGSRFIDYSVFRNGAWCTLNCNPLIHHEASARDPFNFQTEELIIYLQRNIFFLRISMCNELSDRILQQTSEEAAVSSMHGNKDLKMELWNSRIKNFHGQYRSTRNDLVSQER